MQLIKKLSFFCAIVLLTNQLAANATAAQQLPTALASLDGVRLQLEIANTAASREIGLMHRQALAENHGMLFVYPSPTSLCFWMKNTPLPLTIAFLDQDYRIVQFADMQPFSAQTHCSTNKVLAALEMPQGWFKQKQINLYSKLILFQQLKPSTE